MIDRISLMTFSMAVDVALGKLTVLDILTMAKEAGIHAVDVMDIPEKVLNEYREAMEKTGVHPYCYIGTVSFFSQKGEDIEKSLKTQFSNATALGAKLCMIVPVNPRKDGKICEKMGKDWVREQLKKYFTLAVSLGKAYKVPACFETTPRDYTCLSGVEDCRWVLEQVTGLGLVYDMANMLPHGDEPLEYYEALKPFIVHVHVKDVALAKPTWKDRLFCAEQVKDGRVMKCCLTGEGVIPVEEAIKRMEKDGYAGMYALEYSHPEKYPADKAQNAVRLKAHMDVWAALDV